jgi:hypothetical protein
MKSFSHAHTGHNLADRDGLWLGIALLLVGLALLGVWQAPQRINSNSALSLQQAELLLDGAVPYCDFVDTNPPLLIYLSLLPVMLSRTFDVSTIIAFGMMVLSLLVVSGLEIHFLLRQRRLSLPAAGRGLVLLTWLALYFVVDWRGDVGQREHLFILLYIPYLILRILRQRGGSIAPWFAALLGIQAGIGAELKPLFLLLAVNVEIVLLFAARRRRTLLQPEIFALAGVAGVYLMHWLVVPAAMRNAFFGRWLPLANYGCNADNVGFEQVANSILDSPIALAGAASALAAALVCRRRRARFRHHLIAFASLAGMALVLIFLQQKGWSEHRIPLNVAGLLCLAVLVVEGSRQWAVGRHRASVGPLQWLVGGLSLAVLLTVWGAIRWESWRHLPEKTPVQQVVVEHTEPNDRVLVIATTASPAYPLLLQTGRRPGSRYLYTFPMAYLYAHTPPPRGNRPIYRQREDAPTEEQQFLKELEDDVLRRKPELILVQDSEGCIGLPDGFNPYNYLVYTGWTEKPLKSYHELTGFDGWKVFARNP